MEFTLLWMKVQILTGGQGVLQNITQHKKHLKQAFPWMIEYACLLFQNHRLSSTETATLLFPWCYPSVYVQSSPTLQPGGLQLIRLSMEFSRQEYWSGLPFPTSEDFTNPGIELVSCIGRGVLYHCTNP